MSNCFFGREDGFKMPGKKFEDKPYGIYGIVKKAVIDKITKEPIIVSEPVKTDEMQFQKIIDVNSKGCTLSDLVAKVAQTGDQSLLNQRKAIYGDGYKMPRRLEDALQIGVETGALIDKFTPDQIALIAKLNNMSYEERKAFLSSVKERKSEPVKTEPVKTEPVKTEPVIKKEGD